MVAACDISHAAAAADRRHFEGFRTNPTFPGVPRVANEQPDVDPITGAIWTALATVIDPELGLDIVTLGLVYGVELEGATARITYTLTTPGCPMERVISDGVRAAVLLTAGVTRVDTHIVWDPAWHPGMIAPNTFSD
jgi:metal-sulfur cluster biosynthetic enzyme